MGKGVTVNPYDADQAMQALDRWLEMLPNRTNTNIHGIITLKI